VRTVTFEDHFSGHAGRYEAYRPTYPAARLNRCRQVPIGLVAGREMIAPADSSGGLNPRQLVRVADDEAGRDAPVGDVERQYVDDLAAEDRRGLTARGGGSGSSSSSPSASVWETTGGTHSRTWAANSGYPGSG
jgi:hypothetical protein